jgi:hypothetical protein
MTLCDFCCGYNVVKRVNVKMDIEQGPPPTIGVLDLCEACSNELREGIKAAIASMVKPEVRDACPSLTPDQAKQVTAWADKRK